MMTGSHIFYLNDYISTTEYQNLYSRFPTISNEYLKICRKKVINFFKSYKSRTIRISTMYS